jgi:Fe-S-cluster containining protein
VKIDEFIARGLRFECTACGKCCINHGDYQHVFLTEQDIDRTSAALDISRREFLRRYTRRVHGERILRDRDDRCVFLDPDGLCRIYETRPLQCRTFPFWKENLNPRAWKNAIARDCPGVGRGKVVRRATIEMYLGWEREGRYPANESDRERPGSAARREFTRSEPG